MTQEEKLKEAKSLYETANADQRYVLERIFPELKESEDEKTMKEIINYLKKNCRLEWAAWLEKQGERPIRIRSKHAQGKLKELIEKQSHENMVEALRTEYEKGRADAIAELKPIFDYSNADIKQKDYAEKQNTNDGFHPLIVEEIDLWIKENENVHHNDKNIIGVMRDMAYQVSALTKNLYNQKQWKPSGEQIDVLHDAIIYVKDSMFPSKNALKKLYGQLKKIREE